MKKRNFVFTICLVSVLVWSCSHEGKTKDLKEADNRILQQEDGTVSLKLDKAACYSDAANPTNNTADWSVVISKPGRYKVWLSSATKDTTDLSYAHSVRINLLDANLLVDPVCDKIVHNTGEVSYPYFKTESYMGSVYVSEPGEYNIQVISEKVNPKNDGKANAKSFDDTMMLSVMLQPVQKTL